MLVGDQQWNQADLNGMVLEMWCISIMLKVEQTLLRLVLKLSKDYGIVIIQMIKLEKMDYSAQILNQESLKAQQMDFQKDADYDKIKKCFIVNFRINYFNFLFWMKKKSYIL